MQIVLQLEDVTGSLLETAVLQHVCLNCVIILIKMAYTFCLDFFSLLNTSYSKSCIILIKMRRLLLFRLLGVLRLCCAQEAQENPTIHVRLHM